jgi:hypothetical protein
MFFLLLIHYNLLYILVRTHTELCEFLDVPIYSISIDYFDIYTELLSVVFSLDFTIKDGQLTSNSSL